jgi:hypothetical protein
VVAGLIAFPHLHNRKKQLENPANCSWFTIFSISTCLLSETSRKPHAGSSIRVGISLCKCWTQFRNSTCGYLHGVPTMKADVCCQQSYSFVGAMRPLSKFIVCVVILRGRHRGLPLAIDRAIMLPSEVEKEEGDLFKFRWRWQQKVVSAQTSNRFQSSRTI